MSEYSQGDEIDVCVFTTAHDADDSRIVHREIETLSAAGYDVTYFTPFAGDPTVDVVSYDDETSGSIPGVSKRLRWAATVFAKLARTDYDVYHFHDVEALPVGVALRATTDGAVIYDVHENVEDVLGHKDIFPEPVRGPMASAASTVELALARFVDAIVAASPDVAERFAGYDDVTVVTNYPKRRWAEETTLGADGDGDEDENEDESGDGAAGQEPVRFVYCGLLSEGRGILTLADAIERVDADREVELVLGGKYASDEFEERLERRVAGSERIELVGWLPTLADVIDLFRESDVGLLCFHPAPNKTNAIHRSNKLFQYMAAGIPVLVSDVGGWGDFVREQGCGVPVEPGRPDRTAETMAALAADPQRRRELGANGHAAALSRYNWETQRERLLGVYERLVGSGRATPAESSAVGPVGVEAVEDPAATD